MLEEIGNAITWPFRKAWDVTSGAVEGFFQGGYTGAKWFAIAGFVIAGGIALASGAGVAGALLTGVGGAFVGGIGGSAIGAALGTAGGALAGLAGSPEAGEEKPDPVKAAAVEPPSPDKSEGTGTVSPAPPPPPPSDKNQDVSMIDPPLPTPAVSGGRTPAPTTQIT